jgi:hypothetical protein
MYAPFEENMPMRSSLLLFAAVAAVGSSGTASADDLSAGKDLTATIVLNGQTCDKVVNVKRNGDSDYIATCKDGNRYHVFVNAQGRVIVQKL